MSSPLSHLTAIDGRYAEKIKELTRYFSEGALMRYRIRVETEFLIALSDEPKITEVQKFTSAQRNTLRDLYEKFDEKDAERIKKIESTTNHDVKAVEYFIKEKLQKTPLKKYLEFVHFACTSEDINNLAYALMLKEANKNVMIPILETLRKELHKKAKAYKALCMLARTHGQPATPTTLGKELYVFVLRLKRQMEQLKKQEYLGKFSGATGTFAAHAIAYPQVNWPAFSKKFIRSLKLTPNPVTTQIEPHDYQAEIYHNLVRTNTVCVDLARDIWLYISQNYFSQKLKEDEVGSSTMPHKVNPIDFENAEGNLGLANALLGHLANVLPVSRLQRDLTDSTVQRNIGAAYGYALIAYKSLIKGILKLQINTEAISKDLKNNPEVLAEALQTVMRRYGVDKPYEKLKALTRGKKITSKELTVFIDSLDIPKDVKARLRHISPVTYIGYAAKIVL